MKIAFLSETPYQGKWPSDFPNARTEVAWQIALDADHYNVHHYSVVKDYDHVFIIFPKGKTFLSSEGSKLVDGENPVSELLRKDIAAALKKVNKKVHFILVGPHWWYNDYEVVDQIYFYNLVAQCDSIFAHNEIDVKYYRGMFPSKPVETIPTLMIENLVKDFNSTKTEKAIIGGNLARWYGGFESYMVANNFEVPIWTQTSHAMRAGEVLLDGIQHLPRLSWVDWIKALSEFKYAVHLMPTVAAGTFSLNCAYLGIPCIGNEQVDTQRLCHPELSVDVSDIEKAQKLALRLKNDKEFYVACSENTRYLYSAYYAIDVWKNKMESILIR